MFAQQARHLLVGRGSRLELLDQPIPADASRHGNLDDGRNPLAVHFRRCSSWRVVDGQGRVKVANHGGIASLLPDPFKPLRREPALCCALVQPVVDASKVAAFPGHRKHLEVQAIDALVSGNRVAHLAGHQRFGGVPGCRNLHHHHHGMSRRHRCFGGLGIDPTGGQHQHRTGGCRHCASGAAGLPDGMHCFHETFSRNGCSEMGTCFFRQSSCRFCDKGRTPGPQPEHGSPERI